jgi:hypothetical protein
MSAHGDQKSWAKAAREAAGQVARLQFGRKETGLKEFAGGLNPHSLRRAIAATKFVDQLVREAPVTAEQMERQPLASVEHFARWYRRDRAAALAILQRFIDGEFTVEAIGDLESKSRGSETFKRSGRSLEHAYKVAIAKRVERIAHRIEAGLSLVELEERDPWDLLTDFAFKRSDETRLFAALIVGPYRDAEMYKHRMFEWIAKGHFLIGHFRYVSLILPDNADVATFVSWLDAHKPSSQWGALYPSPLELEMIPSSGEDIQDPFSDE